ncbi:MAG TPA: hypothetical protein VLE99_04555 [Candidatus Saccharimonadales bacterium]|nr:hypothetical protein [Candidatus Saccharimonadales bacterium]
MMYETARYPINGVEHAFRLEPPVSLPHQPISRDARNDLPAVVAAHLAQSDPEVFARFARMLFVWAEVAPTPTAYAEQLTRFTGGEPKVLA